MTKKSHARQERDQAAGKMKNARAEAITQIATNPIYDDIAKLYGDCARVLIGYADAFNKLDIAQVAQYFTSEKADKIQALINVFNNDLVILENDLLRLNKPFVEKRGCEPDLDAYMAALGVSDQYGEFLGRAAAALDPTFRQLGAEVTIAYEIAKRMGNEFEVVELTPEEAALQEAQDKNVITTVDVKETV